MGTQALSYGKKLAVLLKHDERFTQEKNKFSRRPQIVIQRPVKAQNITENPFAFAPGLAWVTLWKKEKFMQLEYRRSERQKKIYQKHTFSSRVAHSAFPSVRKMCGVLDDKHFKGSTNDERTIPKSQVRSVDNEITLSFVQRKREIFLIEFALHTKRQEIRKLKEKLEDQDRKFTATAKRLHEDIVLFDDFLKATDDAAVESMQTAELETELKAETINECKEVLDSATALRDDIEKKEEVLTDFMSYRSFLFLAYENSKSDDLPVSKTGRKTSIRKSSFSGKDAKRKSETKIKSLSRKSISKPRNSPKSQQQKRVQVITNGESAQVAPDQMPFDTPCQLINIIKDLEENNVKLICKFQDTEEELDNVRRMVQKGMKQMREKTTQLLRQVKNMRRIIAKWENRSGELSLMCTILSDGSKNKDSNKALAELEANVEEVYQSIFGNTIVSLDALIMLTSIETRMDELLDEEEGLDDDAVNDAQRTIEKERRRQLREIKIEMQKIRQEERAQKVAERANAESFKRTGKLLMFRSTPPKIQLSRKFSMRTCSDDSLNYFLEE